MLKVFATFLKKGSAKNFPTGKILGYFSKIVRSTVVVNRRAFFNYAVGVWGLKFNTATPELGCRHCRPFLKKGSAKNFPTGKILGYFSKKVRSTVVVNRRAFFILSGVAVTILIPLRPSFRQQIYNASVGERSGSMKGSLREGAVERMWDWRSTRAV